MSFIIVSALAVFMYTSGVWSLYFPQTTYYGNVEPSDEVGQGLVKLYSVFNASDRSSILGHRKPSVDYNIIAVSGGKEGVDYHNTFGLNRSGWVYLNDSDVYSSSQGTTVTLIVRAVVLGLDDPVADVVLTFRDPADDPCADYCFVNSFPTLHVEENSGVVVLGRVGKNVRHGACSDVELRYAISSLNVLSGSLLPARWLMIEKRRSELFSMGSFDREAWSEGDMRVTCQVKHRNGSQQTIWQDIHIRVSDVDDNPPELYRFYSGVQTRQEEWDLSRRKKSLRITVCDNDIAGTSEYEISLLDNDRKLFNLSNRLMFPISARGRWNQTTLTAVIELTDGDVPADFVNTTFKVIFRDISYQRQPRSEMSNTVVVEVRAILPNVQETDTITVQDRFQIKISPQAANYSRVFNSAKALGLTQASFNLQNDFGVFNITPNTGIIYVENPAGLLASFLNLTVVYSAQAGKNKTLSINVEITTGDVHAPRSCESTCAAFTTTAECEQSCGLGVPSGRCTMRNPIVLRTMTSEYSTCSPNLATCPDFVCDELENKFIGICPQDCTENPLGAILASKDKNRTRGIHFASGLCSCDSRGKCLCLQPFTKPSATTQPIVSLPSVQRPRTATSGNNVTPSASSSVVTKVSDVTKEGVEGVGTACGVVCRAVVALGLLAVIVVAGICVSVWCVRRRRKRQTDQLKHVGSNVSMNAIPSDYVEERRTSHNSIEWSPKIVNNPTYDQKWEFPRQDLVLGKNLGEGEFGQVVKAKAFHLNNKEEYTLVAVKMLKNCSNETEYRDLVSEFNLLKDVHHPNVIKLLGACTREEPLYIIVEYCAHGSLRHYLRTCRHNNALYMEMNREVNPGPVDPKPRVQLKLSTRDLLSFAWQIAKGMHYLAEMKVVHRDLAARNVLVASGKVVKISDFGLSRDVYEADAYMKKSKGRIPVKWMAPESLYDQVYTTKSDVWSYGIVLWEIVTLGATPYPGILPERLFGLLRSGYRMDRPDNCSDELYAVMQKCWKAEPQRRPFFSDLVDIFDSMLQAKMEYLDLNGALKGPFDFEYDAREDGLTSGEGRSGSPYPWGTHNGQAYGNVSSDLYLTPTSASEQISNRDNNTRGKTFPKQDLFLQVKPPPDKRRVKLEVDMETDDEVFEPKETDSLRCTNV